MEDKPRCPNCGNRDWQMMSVSINMNKKATHVCEQCDPINWIPHDFHYICPYNDIYCMWEHSEGIRGWCACGMKCSFIEKSRQFSAFCTPNHTLIDSLIRNKPHKFTRLLKSKKKMRKFFIYPDRVLDRYEKI